MDGILFWILVIVIICFYMLKKKKKENERNERKNDIVTLSENPFPSPTPLYRREYTKKSLMTNYEKIFYEKLSGLSEEYFIIPQVNLAAIVEKKSNIPYHTELFRNIDFGIFDKYTNEVLLLIEINDKTHNYNSRKKRDNSVRTICEEAGIKIITFYTSYPNETEYVINRIKKEINEIKNQNQEDNNITLETQ